MELKKIFEKFKSIEKYIAIKNDKLDVFVKKWENDSATQKYSIGQNISAFVNQYVMEM